MHRANLRVYGTGTPFLMKWERHDDVYIRQFTLIYHKSIKMTKVFMSHLNTLIKQTKTCIIFITPVSSVTCFVCRISEIIKQKTKNTTSSFNILFFSFSFFIYSTHLLNNNMPTPPNELLASVCRPRQHTYPSDHVAQTTCKQKKICYIYMLYIYI